MIETNIQLIIDEYKILWDYYKKTLDERNEMFKNYSIFIGIPTTILSVVPQFLSSYLWVIGLLLIIVSLIGISICYTYISECITSNRYLYKIDEIRSYLTNHFKLPENLLNSNDTFNNKKTNIIVKASKCFPLCILNSFALFAGLYISFSNCIVITISFSVLTFLGQMFFYTIWQYKHSKKQYVEK